MKRLLTFWPLLLALYFPPSLMGQACNTYRNLPEFADCEVNLLVRQRLSATDTTKQAEEPALSPSSTALADRSSAPDVAGVSLNLAPLSSKSRTANSSDLSVTISMFGLYSALRQRSPFDQELYENSSGWRRFSFSLGQSFPEDLTSTAAKGSYTTQGKYLLSSSRDVRDPSNSKAINGIANALNGQAAQEYLQIYGDIQEYLYGQFDHSADHGSVVSRNLFIASLNQPESFAAILQNMTDQQLRHIQQIIESRISSQVRLAQSVKQVVDRIMHQPQFSAAFSSRISKGTGANLYRSEFIADVPLTNVLTSTTNVSYDFQNAQLANAFNRQIARAVEQFQYSFGNARWLPPKNPFTLAFSGEGDWGTNGTPIYKGQFKIGIPILTGLQLPLAFLYSSQTATSRHSDAKVQLGIVIDSSKLAGALKSH